MTSYPFGSSIIPILSLILILNPDKPE